MNPNICSSHGMYKTNICKTWDRCYNLKLGSGCNLGKDLSKSRRDDKLVKHKDIGLYLQLYISIDHEEYIICSWENNKEEENKEISTTIWG